MMTGDRARLRTTYRIGSRYAKAYHVFRGEPVVVLDDTDYDGTLYVRVAGTTRTAMVDPADLDPLTRPAAAG